MKSLTIPVRAGAPRRTYRITIAQDLTADLAAHLESLRKGSRAILVSSPKVWELHGPRLAAGLPETPCVLIPDGERAKRLRTVNLLFDRLVSLNTDRQTTLVVAGGGVLGDLAGFAAASYLRGIPLVHVPTTVVAQVDSAIGGKVGVNHPLGKNLIGAFYPPAAVLTDPQFLTTLSAREFRAGLYEVIKYGVIDSPSLFERLESTLPAILSRDPRALLPIIAACSRIKARVVSADEHETGERRILNFGHTAGHALEAITEYRRFRHGEAVGHGMLAATAIATTRGLLSKSHSKRIVTLIEQTGTLPALNDLSAAACVDATKRDKKVVRGTLHFVLPSAIGRTKIVPDVTPRELTKALRDLGMRA